MSEKITCPCRLRDYMDTEDCDKTPCAVCCPLAAEADDVPQSQPLTPEEAAALARAAIGGGLL